VKSEVLASGVVLHMNGKGYSLKPLFSSSKFKS
jgi:hypothetical protein